LALGPLGSRSCDPVCRQIMARAHPDLLVLQRDAEDGKPRKSISVDDARGLAEFFSKSPAASPYRVAIIDTADDLNVNAANAVLKSLEEPPERGVLLLVSHAPGRLLATLRSRCRRLRFEAPPLETATPWLIERTGLGEDEARRLLAMANGAPGRAWGLAVSGALEVDRQARLLLQALPKFDAVAMVALAEGFRTASGAARFELLMDRLADCVHGMVTADCLAADEPTGRATLGSWAEAWEILGELPRAAEAVNLDRGDAFLTALSQLQAIAQGTSAC
ncbi:MAG: DNA polymerase III subunit delta', partial [Pseudomonadota bacterium]|nr:DNA polymerase III subunit delta' [Pseudomonadota bacterium]